MTTAPQPIWEKRWLALASRIKGLHTEIGASKRADADAFRTLVEALHNFGEKQFYFFYCGFLNGSAGPCVSTKDGGRLSQARLRRTFERYGYPSTNQFDSNPLTYLTRLPLDRFGSFSAEFRARAAEEYAALYPKFEQPRTFYAAREQRSQTAKTSNNVKIMASRRIGKSEDKDGRGDKRQHIKCHFDNVRLERCRAYPPAYVLRVILDQIGYDLGALERAWYQRVNATTQTDAFLKLTSFFANDAIDKAESVNLLGTTSVITFMALNPSIRIIPYANVAFIAVPYSALNNNRRDMLVIAHEAGHQLFWRGVTPDPNTGLPKRIVGDLTDRLDKKNRPDYVYGWIEEIFADVFSSVVAGPASQIMIHDIHIDDLPAHRTRDDGTYPPAAVRSESIAVVWPGDGTGPMPAAKPLEGIELDQKYQNNKFTPKDQQDTFGDSVPSAKRKNLAEAAKTMRSVAREIYKAYFTGFASGWTKNTGVDPLDQLGQFSPSPISSLNKLVAQSISWVDVMKEINGEITNRLGKDEIPFALWLPVFSSDGWTLEGPEDDIFPG